MIIAMQSGRQVDLSNLRPDDICLPDIAYSLSHQNRFSGHCGSYSVAQHSVLVSRMVSHENALVALCHDFTEAFVGDLASPIKHLCPAYQDLEDRLWRVVAERFGLPLLIPDEVHAADRALCCAEALRFFGVDWSEKLGEPASVEIEAMDSLQAEHLLVNEFYKLRAEHRITGMV